ncbi:MAG: transposase [Succinivibrio sp.]|nr:transposase [Succinivibrio sp.]
MYNYEEFAECTRLPFQRPLSSTQINRLCCSITEEQIEKFFVYMDEEFRLEHAEKEQFSPTFLALDSTSLSTYARPLSAADYGHNKDGDALPQVNLLFLTGQSTGLPLYYRTYDGAVPDISTLRKVIASRERLKLNNSVVFVSDKGYMSAQNINDCLRNNIHFIFNCKLNGHDKTFVQDLVDEHLNDLVNTTSKVRSIKQ